MSETLLIILGVTVFAITIVGVLNYFYTLLVGLDAGSDSPDRGAVPGTGDDDV
jgi:hypothetical protein